MQAATTTKAPADIATQAELASFDFTALITPKQADELESIAQERWGVDRRVALAILTRSKAELVAGITTDEAADAMLGTLDNLRDLGQQLKNQAEYVRHAEVRLLCALSAYGQASEGTA